MPTSAEMLKIISDQVKEAVADKFERKVGVDVADVSRTELSVRVRGSATSLTQYFRVRISEVKD